MLGCHSIIGFEELSEGDGPLGASAGQAAAAGANAAGGAGAAGTAAMAGQGGLAVGGQAASGAPAAGAAGQGASGAGGRQGEGGRGGAAGDTAQGGAGAAGEGQGGAGGGEAGAAGKGGSAGEAGAGGEGGTASEAGHGGAAVAGGGSGGASGGISGAGGAGSPCEGAGSACLDGVMYRCQLGVWTVEPCSMGCAPSGASCMKYVDIAAGAAFSCVLRSDGKVWCWGSSYFDFNPDGPIGALGVPPEELPFTEVPVEMTALPPFKQLAATMTTICGLTDGGKVLCWGRNGPGCELGQPASLPYSYQALAVPGLPDDIEQLTGGFATTCARSATGDVYCWGARITDKGGTVYENGAEIEPRLKDASTFALATLHACGLYGGKLRCFGNNEAGQLALPLDTPASAEPTGGNAPLVPWVGVGMGEYTTFAWTDDTFYGWGNSNEGELGYYGDGVSAPPTVLDSYWRFFDAKIFKVKQVAGGFRSICVLIEEDAFRHVRCAGLNDAFQCGGDETYALDPYDISDPVKPIQTEKIAGGWRHYCGIRLGGGSVACWGIGFANGGTVKTATPVTVALPK